MTSIELAVKAMPQQVLCRAYDVRRPREQRCHELLLLGRRIASLAPSSASAAAPPAAPALIGTGEAHRRNLTLALVSGGRTIQSSAPRPQLHAPPA